MTIAEATEECERWFAHLDRQREKTRLIAQLAAERKAGTCTQAEAERRMRVIDGAGVTVFDGAKLEQAVKSLLAHIRSGPYGQMAERNARSTRQRPK